MESDCQKCGYKVGTFLHDIDVPRLEGESRCCALKRIPYFETLKKDKKKLKKGYAKTR